MVNWEPVSSSLGFIKEFVHLNIMFYHQLLGSVVETFVKKLCTRSGKKTSVGPLTQPIPRKKKKKNNPDQKSSIAPPEPQFADLQDTL